MNQSDQFPKYPKYVNICNFFDSIVDDEVDKLDISALNISTEPACSVLDQISTSQSVKPLRGKCSRGCRGSRGGRGVVSGRGGRPVKGKRGAALEML